MTSWGWSLRRLTATEKIGGTDPVTGGFVRRGCQHCAAEAEFRARYFTELAVGGGPVRRQPYRRDLCLHHAERFATAHALRPPADLPRVRVEQQVLPLGGA